MTVPEHPDTGASAERVARLERIARVIRTHAHDPHEWVNGEWRWSCGSSSSGPYATWGKAFDAVCSHAAELVLAALSREVTP